MRSQGKTTFSYPLHRAPASQAFQPPLANRHQLSLGAPESLFTPNSTGTFFSFRRRRRRRHCLVSEVTKFGANKLQVRTWHRRRIISLSLRRQRMAGSRQDSCRATNPLGEPGLRSKKQDVSPSIHRHRTDLICPSKLLATWPASYPSVDWKRGEGSKQGCSTRPVYPSAWPLEWTSDYHHSIPT